MKTYYIHMIDIKGFSSASIADLMKDKNQPKVKKYFVADVSGNITDIYYAPANTVSGVACLRQRFEYNTISGVGAVVQKEAWENANWGGASWDIV